jgi:hypothetical protein
MSWDSAAFYARKTGFRGMRTAESSGKPLSGIILPLKPCLSRGAWLQELPEKNKINPSLILFADL